MGAKSRSNYAPCHSLTQERFEGIFHADRERDEQLFQAGKVQPDGTAQDHSVVPWVVSEE